jgi:ATP-dependent Zn protease
MPDLPEIFDIPIRRPGFMADAILIGRKGKHTPAPAMCDPQTLRRIAIHEAGHAIVAMHLGREVYSLSIEGNGGSASIESLDQISIDRMAPAERQSWLEADLLIQMGGIAAEWEFCGTVELNTVKDDRANAWQTASQLRETKVATERLIDEAVAEARKLLRARAKEVNALAKQLAERNQLAQFELCHYMDMKESTRSPLNQSS